MLKVDHGLTHGLPWFEARSVMVGGLPWLKTCYETWMIVVIIGVDHNLFHGQQRLLTMVFEKHN